MSENGCRCSGCTKAKKATVERIIKLLKETDLLKTIEQGAMVNYAEDAIALIKEEFK